MKIAFNPSTVAALIAPPNNKDITFDLRGQNIFARGVKFCGTDTNTWRDIKINNVSIDSNILDLRDGDNTTLTNINGVVTINSTWRPVVDNLTSDSTTSSLSANLGRVLKSLIDGKSDSEHTHDDRYLRLTGGLMLGDITFGGDNKIIWGRNTDSASISFKNDGDGDADSYMSFVTSDNGNEYFRWSHSSGSTNTEWMSLRSDGLRVGGTKVSLEGHSHNDLYYTKTEVNNKLNGKSDTSHTHDDRYLKLTGGIVNGVVGINATGVCGNSVLTVGPQDKRINNGIVDRYGTMLQIVGTGKKNEGAVIGFHNPGLYSGILGFVRSDNETGFIFDTDVDRNSWYVKARAFKGNLIGDADSVDGYHETAFPRLVGIKSNTWNWNDVIRAGYYKIQSGTITNHPSGIYPFGMAEVITTENHNDGENRELQIYYPHSQTNNIAIWLRMHNSSTQGNGWGSWVGVPNTNGNIASASKLQTPRTIWGQSFDGTANVDGMFSGSKGMKINGVWIGLNTNSESRNQTIDCDGNDNLYLNYYRAKHVITNIAGGNLGVGTYNPAYKLHVAGDIYSTEYIRASSGFIKGSSSDSYVLLGGGGHKLESALSVANADTVDGFHYHRFVYNSTFGYNRNGPYYKKIASVNTANWTWSSASLIFEVFSTGYSNGVCYLGTVEVTCGHWNNTDHNPSVTCRWILKVPNSGSRIVTIKNLNTNTIDVYLANDLWDCGITFNVTYNNGFSILNVSLPDGGFVNLPTASSTIIHYTPSNPTYVGNSTSATNSDMLDGYHASGLLTSITNSNNGISITVGGTTKSVSNISVNYASSAGNADTVDGYHASSLWRSDGGIWNPGANISLTASGDNQEWSFDIRRNGHTGCYWHVWDSALSTLLKVNADNGKVYAPYNFVGNLEGNASSAAKSEYSRSLLGRSTSGSDYDTNKANLVFAEWNTMNDNRWYLKATGYECRVAFASSAGNADTVDGYHATDGRTFTGNINWSPNWNDTWSDGTNKHPWYGFDHRYSNTGAYSTTLTDYFGMTIKTANTLRLDFGTLLLNGTSIYSINVASATKLQTPRSIWGQSFDGTSDVNGTIYINNSDSSNGAIRLNNDRNSNARISAISDQVIFNTGSAIRFGETAWDWNQWAGLKYTHSNKTIYLGIADGSAFNANSAQTDGILRLAGITTVTPDSEARIGNSGGDLYLGNADNSSWVKVQDMCSQTTSDNWVIYQSGSAEFKDLTIYGDVSLCVEGGNVGISNSSPSYKLDVNGLMRASGFRHSGHNSDDAVLLAGGGYKTLSDFTLTSHNHDGRYVRAFGTSNDNIDSDWGQSFKTFDPIPSGTPPELNPNISILNIGENFDRRKLLAFIYSNDNIYYRRHVDGSFTNWVRLALINDVNNYYWANVKISDSSSTTTSPTVSNLTATSSIRMGNILLEHTDEINNSANSGLHLNYRNSGNISLCQGGGKVGIGTVSPSYKLDVNGNIWCRGALNVGSTLSITDSVINCSSSNISIKSKESGSLMIGSLEVISYDSNYINITNKTSFTLGLGLMTNSLGFTSNTYTTDDVTVLIGILMANTSFLFKPAMDGLLLFLKIGRRYSNIYFLCTAAGCEVVKANGFDIHLAKNETKNYFTDGLARIFIYVLLEARWYEFYCG